MVREMLRVTSEFGAWIFGVSATVDVRMLCPANVEYWALEANAHRSLVWRRHTRWLLRRVGRAVFADGWAKAPVGEPIGRRPPSGPYGPGDEAAFRLSACLPARAEPAGRRWVVAATLGAGLLSPAVAAAEPGDLVNLGNDRLGIRVGGRHPRVVPIRADYSPLVTEAAGLVGDRSLRSGHASHSGVHVVPPGRDQWPYPFSAACPFHLAGRPPTRRHSPVRAPPDRRSAVG